MSLLVSTILLFARDYKNTKDNIARMEQNVEEMEENLRAIMEEKKQVAEDAKNLLERVEEISVQLVVREEAFSS